MEIFYLVITAILVLAGIFATIRFIKGPTAADRVVAMDNLSIIITSALVFAGLYFERYIYIDVSLVYAVLGFIGVLAIARYLEGGF